jgi:hypothetical protein
MWYEMRTYHCAPGKMKAVQDRFADSVVHLFARHGFDPVGFWTVAIGESSNDLIYMLRWHSMAEREAAWAALAEDPDWPLIRDRTEANGPIVNSISSSILKPTRFSPGA